MKAKNAVAGAAVAAVLLLGGCSDYGATNAGAPAGEAATQAVSATVLADAVKAAQAAGSARITGSITTTSAEGAASATLAGVQSFAPAAMDLTVNSGAFAGGASVRQVLAEGEAYVQVPELGSKWVSIDLGQFAGMLSPLLTDLDLSALPELQAAGTGTVEGAAVTFYTAEVDLDQALELSGMPADARAQVGGAFAEESGRAAVKIAIDEAGRLVEWQLDSTVNLADGGSVTSLADLRFYDFGVSTTIVAPPADEVIDGQALKGQLPGGTTATP